MNKHKKQEEKKMTDFYVFMVSLKGNLSTLKIRNNCKRKIIKIIHKG